MSIKKAFIVAATLAFVEQALGFNAHRHLHNNNNNNKRAIVYDIVTDYVTVTVFEPSTPNPTPTPTPSSSASVKPFVEAELPKPSTSISSISVIPTPAPPAPVPTTTLVTSVTPKVSAPPAPASSSTAPAVQAQAVAASAPAAPAAPADSKPVSAAAAPASLSSTSTGGKRGLAYNDAGLVSNFFSNGNSCPECSWAYNWDSSSNGLSESLNYVPMLWGPIATHTDRWQANANSAISAGSTNILSFNECDLPSQCNLSPAAAAAAHVQWMNPFAGKVRIGAPAVTNSNIAGQGLDWLKAFVSACDSAGCSYDFCVTHWYSPASDPDALFSHLQSVHDICNGKPVWLTEFAPLGSDDEISSFVQTNVPKLDAVSYLERYSYFMVSDGVLTSGNSLSSLGKTYASAA